MICSYCHSKCLVIGWWWRLQFFVASFSNAITDPGNSSFTCFEQLPFCLHFSTPERFLLVMIKIFSKILLLLSAYLPSAPNSSSLVSWKGVFILHSKMLTRRFCAVQVFILNLFISDKVSPKPFFLFFYYLKYYFHLLIYEIFMFISCLEKLDQIMLLKS